MSRLLRWAARLPQPLRRRLLALPGAGSIRDRLSGRPAGPGPAPGALRAVVYLPTWARWDVMRQRPQYLLSAFAAAGHPVFFVDPREPRARQADGVHLVPDLSVVPAGGVLLYVHFAPVATQFDLFDDPVVVYDVLDDLSIYEPDETHLPPDRRVAAHHPAVIRSADAVIVSASALADRHRHERPDLMLVPNGVDPARFGASAEPPSDLPPRPRGQPVVGYHGAVSSWFDFTTLAAVARRRPDWQFVLVGPVAAECRADATAVKQLGNVFFLGERPSDTMPGYVQAFDVGVVWFRVDALTEAVSPLKMYEYLAAGIPCVSSPLPEAVAQDLVRTAATPDEFEAAIAASLAEAATPGFRDRATAAGAAAGWDRRLDPLLERLDASGARRVSPQ